MRGELRVDFGVDAQGGLVGPEAGDVTGSVAAAADNEEGQVEGFNVFKAGAVGFYVEVEAAKTIAAKGVGAALEDDCCGLVFSDARTDDILE